MKPREVVAFVNGAETIVRYLRPTVGAEMAVRSVFAAKARGDHIATVCNSDDPDELFSTYISYVREIIPLSEKAIAIVIDDVFPPQTLRFERVDPKNKEIMARWTAGSLRYDGVDEEAERMMDLLLNQASTPIEPKLDTQITFMRWSEAGNGVEPRGVFYYNDGEFGVLPFPQYADAAGAWEGAFKNITERDFIEEIPGLVGRSTVVSGAEFMRGSGVEDAALRALYKYGEEYYQKTGRSLF